MQNCYKLTKAQRRYQWLKRSMDVFLALVGLVVLCLPFLLIALLQKLTEPGQPVFFRQRRIGRGGKEFVIWKFRSLSGRPGDLSTEERAGQSSGMTAFGRFLRDSSVDELPQLLQVLTGKMSLVGPRPLIPREEKVHELRHALGVYQLRPGITGWAQIHGRDFVGPEDKAALDREYLERMGLKTDLYILARTLVTAARRENIK